MILAKKIYDTLKLTNQNILSIVNFRQFPKAKMANRMLKFLDIPHSNQTSPV